MFSPAGAERICKNMLYSIVGIDYHKNRAVSTKSFENALLSARCKKKRWKLWQKERGPDGTSPLDKLLLLKRRCCGRTGERTPLVPPQVCARWAKTINCHAHPRILLPQNRSLPHLLAAPFPHQPEPRCNTLDFAEQNRVPRWTLSPLDPPAKGNAVSLWIPYANRDALAPFG